MSKTVEIMGGPDDGKLLEMQDAVWELKIAMMRKPEAVWDENPLPPAEAVGYIQVVLPIVRRGHRWYAVWREPQC